MSKGIVYDAAAVAHILGVRVECSVSTPKAADDEIVVYYGGWNLVELQGSPAGSRGMWQDQKWYHSESWSAKVGYYRLLLPVPRSSQKRFDQQVDSLRSVAPTFHPAPICIAATALLLHLMDTGDDLLNGHWCRCAESVLGGARATLTVDGGRVRIYYHPDDLRDSDLLLSASGRC